LKRLTVDVIGEFAFGVDLHAMDQDNDTSVCFFAFFLIILENEMMMMALDGDNDDDFRW
jgi:hypothetical protein